MGKKKKRKEIKIDYYELAKLLGYKSERKVNKAIHHLLEDGKMINLLKCGAKIHGKWVKDLREYMNLLTVYLNIPTKDDVANVGKLAKQIEEKLDSLEERITPLPYVEKKKSCKKRLTKEEIRERLLKNLINSINQQNFKK
ncbi:hypothetical protein N0O92_15325 [Alkalihalobacillus sp. MEB130]|uniref:hypothetical protein n=1 Tax=Alkalihalobacillus sp. MEB130 TaxID=2976704 RepID=UPI0028DE2666|nr:hypothetical protein [Alkalihalobacillus sp. MEB130]MDT8861588.1 hypothetical protein [Alkalihalobacillus sp. MEB130]